MWPYDWKSSILPLRRGRRQDYFQVHAVWYELPCKSLLVGFSGITCIIPVFALPLQCNYVGYILYGTETFDIQYAHEKQGAV